MHFSHFSDQLYSLTSLRCLNYSLFMSKNPLNNSTNMYFHIWALPKTSQLLLVALTFHQS